MRIVDRAARWTLAAAVAGSLSFGVSQAVAAPAGTGDVRACTPQFCPQTICKCLNGACVDRTTGTWCFA